MERKYSVPSNPDSRQMLSGAASEDLHAWSIYRYITNRYIRLVPHHDF